MSIETTDRYSMELGIFSHLREWLAPPHPTWQSKVSRTRVLQFLRNEQIKSPGGLRLNVGSASRRFGIKTLNLDLFAGEEIDIQGDLLHFPMKDESVDTIVCTGVLEHVSDPHRAVEEIYRVLKFRGKGVYGDTFHADSSCLTKGFLPLDI